MGFPPELWFDDELGAQFGEIASGYEDASVAARLEHLFRTLVVDEEETPYTNNNVARMSMGRLTEDEIVGIRSGEIESPTIDQVVVLSEVFGVSPSYFTRRRAPLLSSEAVAALTHHDASDVEIFNKTLALSEGEKKTILQLLDHLGHLHQEEPDETA